MSSYPPTIKDFIGKGDQRPGVYNNQNDPFKYTVARSRFERPTLSAGKLTFEWPIGVEGIAISGAPTLAEHRYIGDDDIVLQVTHQDDQRIVLSGMLPGLTGSKNMKDLMAVIRAVQPAGGKILRLPSSVYPTEIKVAVADYSFNHDEDDRNSSWVYSLTLRRIGLGKTIKRPKSISSKVNPTTKTSQPKGKSSRVFTVHAGANTLRAIAQIVYGNSTRWDEIYNLNKKALGKLKTPIHAMPTKRLPLGMKLAY